MMMNFYPEIHHRRSIRLKGYDYSQVGVYFVTVCTLNRNCLFGEILEGNVWLNNFGKIIEREWLQTTILRPNVVLDAFVVMPNHFHAIVMITDNCRGVLQYAPTFNQLSLRSPSQTIGAIVRGFKSATTKRINQIRQTPGISIWQRNYYEHIIGDEDKLNRIRQYIIENPLKWEIDRENPLGQMIQGKEPWQA